MKAIGYFRVPPDSDDLAEPAQKEQEQRYLSLCRQRGYEPVATFVERDAGRKASLSEFERMLRYIRQQTDNIALLVKNVKHLHPEPQEAAKLILELETSRVDLILMDEEAMDPLESAVALWRESRGEKQGGDKVREAMKYRAIHGMGLGKTPFGYRIGANQKLEVVPEEAETVIQIYRMYLERNMGFRLIARHLNEQGITTRRGGRWSIVGIRDILRNRVYLGTYARFGLRVPSSHRAIVPEFIFKRVQEKLNAMPKSPKRAERNPFLLSGMVYCGYCGSRMTGVNRSQTWLRSRDGGRSRKTYRYYQCQSRTNQSFCQYHTRKADDLETLVMSMLHRYSDAHTDDFASAQGNHDHDAEAAEQAMLTKKLKAMQRKFRSYLDETARGDMSLDDLREKGGELVRQGRLLERRLALATAELNGELTPEQRRAYRLEALSNMNERWESMELPSRRELLQYLVERIVVYDDHVETKLRL